MHPDLEALLILQRKDEAVRDTDKGLAALDPELAKLDQAAVAGANRSSRWRTGASRTRWDGAASWRGRSRTTVGCRKRAVQRLEWVKGAKEAW